MKNFFVPLFSTPGISRLLFIALTFIAGVSSATAQDGNRWYQIEVTVFAHENSNTQQEQWPTEATPASPASARELDSLLKHLTPDDWIGSQPPAATAANGVEATESNLSPGPDGLRSSDYRLPDAERDAFVALPVSEHDFTQTNRALSQSANYRVLAHHAWRQPVMRADAATPIAIIGGRQFDDQHELEGTLTIRFNQSRDRVMLDTDLRLTQFSARPSDMQTQAMDQDTEQDTEQERQFFASTVFPMRDSRAMRSNEFHYLDHPAMGVLVQVFPYEPPAASVTSFPETIPPL